MTRHRAPWGHGRGTDGTKKATAAAGREEAQTKVPGGNAEGENGRLVVRPSLPTTLLGVLGSALFVAGGAYLCARALVPGVSAEPPASPLSRIAVLAAGAAGLLFFGFALVFLLGRLLRFRRPILEVGPEGILDRASALGAGFVPWEEVEGARVRRFLGPRLLAVEVRDERALLARQGPARRLLMAVNRRILGTPVLVPLGLLAVGEDTLLREIERHLSRSRAARGSGRDG